MPKTESKCAICSEETTKNTIELKEWIIDGKSEAKAGDKVPVHADCLTNSLYIERPEGFVYGRITLHKEDKDVS